MRNVSKWLSVLWLPASILLAQEGDVTVVFAPEHKREAKPAEAPGKSIGHAMRFEARGGVVGLRLGNEAMAHAVITADTDGRPHLQCVRTIEEIQRLKTAGSTSRPARKGAANAK